MIESIIINNGSTLDLLWLISRTSRIYSCTN
eukprot:UN10386